MEGGTLGLFADKLEGCAISKANQPINQTQCIKGTEGPLCFHRRDMQPQERRLVDSVQTLSTGRPGGKEEKKFEILVCHKTNLNIPSTVV